MSCNLIYKNGKLEEVRADNGSPSILFERAKQIFGEETAKEIFYVSKSDQFQEVFKATIEVYKQRLLNKVNVVNDVRFSVGEEKTKMTLKEFADASAVQMLKGENIKFKKPTLPKFKGNDDIDRIKNLDTEGNEDGATFNLDGSTYDKGGLVIPVISKNITQEDLSKEVIENFIQENSDKIGADTIKVGIYKFEDSNKVSIDLNIVVDSKSKSLALVFGKYAGQESLFNLDTFENVKTGADGVNPKTFTDEEFRDIADSLSKGKLPILLSLSPETSANYANLTEDGEGNFIFYHLGDRGYEVIKKGTGQNKTTSREEATAISRVGGLAMYYPADNVGESMISNNTKYLVKVPKEKVYDFNRDLLNFLPEAEALFRKEYPNQAFDTNTQLAYVTKVANEKGYDAVVAQWNGTTRVQTTKELKHVDEKYLDGNTTTKDFKPENKFISNKDKGWLTQEKVSQSQLLADVYEEISNIIGNDYSNPLYRLREMSGYKLGDKFAPFKTQQEITDAINISDISEELKNKYFKALVTGDTLGYSYLPNNRFSKSPQLKVEKKEVNGKLVFEPTINGQKAGGLRLLPYKDGYRVEGVVVYDRFQGRRLATRLYQEAIKDLLPKGKSLYSLKTRSAGAEAIWDKFVEKGIAKKVNDTDYVVDIIPPFLDRNGEPKLEEVTKFISNDNKSTAKLSTDEKAEVLNFMLSNGVTSFNELKQKVRQAFYNDLNIFTINRDKLLKSGLYDKSTIRSLSSEVQPFIESLLNTDFDIDLSLDNLDYVNVGEKTIFGNYRKVPIEKVNQGNTQILDSDLQVKPNNNTKAKLEIASKKVEDNKSLNKINTILETSDEVIEENPEIIEKLLNEITNDLANYGIDLEGLKVDKDFLRTLRDFIISPTNNNLNSFTEAYNNQFSVDTTPQFVRTQDDKKYFIVDTDKTEQEVFEEQSLIKQSSNLYYKVIREDVDTLIAKLNLEDKRGELEAESRQQEGFTDPDLALEVLLYKKAFNTPTIVKEQEQGSVDNFSGNYEYLTTEYVADFHVEMIKEKQKNSLKYKNFYSLFDINEKGIYLKDSNSYTMSLVELYADENLRQYSLISKQLPNLKVEEQDVNFAQQERDRVVNNKKSLPEFKGKVFRIDNNNVVVKAESGKFIKIDNQVYESVQKSGELKLFSKVEETQSEYLQANIPQPIPNLDINNYNHLKTTPEKFLTEGKLKSKAEKDKIKTNKFDCL